MVNPIPHSAAPPRMRSRVSPAPNSPSPERRRSALERFGLKVGDRRCGVVGTCDGQSRGADRGQVGSQIHGRDHLAACRIAVRWGCGHGFDRGLDPFGLTVVETFRVPATDDRFGDCPRSFGAHHRRALAPGLCRRQMCRGAEHREPIDAIRMRRRQPESRHSAQRESDEMNRPSPRVSSKVMTSPTRSSMVSGRVDGTESP